MRTINIPDKKAEPMDEDKIRNMRDVDGESNYRIIMDWLPELVSGGDGLEDWSIEQIHGYMEALCEASNKFEATDQLA